MGKSRTLAKIRGIRAGAWGKTISPTLKEGAFQGGEAEQGKRYSLREVGESMSKSVDPKAFQDDLESFGFPPSLAKSEIGKGVERQRAHS